LFRLPGARTITLGPLDIDAAAEIVGSPRAAELHARSGGHPLFLVRAGGRRRRQRAAGQHPARRRRALRSGRCGRGHLRAAAVIGPEIDLDLLAAVTATTPGELLDHLEEGMRRRFLVEQGPRFTFAHALVREALAATVGASRTAYIHRMAARALAAGPVPTHWPWPGTPASGASWRMPPPCW